MTHDHGKQGHSQDHDHGHNHGHDHHHDHHLGDHHHHEWHSDHYVGHWVENDARRQGERRPIIARLIAAVPSFGHEAEFTVLDVGAGAGAIAEALLEAFPCARIVLQDYSPPMLSVARKRLGQHAARTSYVLCD